MFQQFSGGAIALHFSSSWHIHAVTLMALAAVSLGVDLEVSQLSMGPAVFN